MNRIKTAAEVGTWPNSLVHSHQRIVFLRHISDGYFPPIYFALGFAISRLCMCPLMDNARRRVEGAAHKGSQAVGGSTVVSHPKEVLQLE